MPTVLQTAPKSSPTRANSAASKSVGWNRDQTPAVSRCQPKPPERPPELTGRLASRNARSRGGRTCCRGECRPARSPDEGCGLCGHEVADAVGVCGIDVIIGVEAETTPGQVRSEPTAAPGAAVESAYCAPAVCWEPPSMAAFYSPRPNQSARLGRHIRTPPTPCPELALSLGASREQSLGSWPKPTLRHSPS